MCGVFGTIGGGIEFAEAGAKAVAHRGPDASGIVEVDQVALAHVRLAILDLDSRSDQPFKVGRVVLSFNGEIWNHRELRGKLASLGRKFVTESDTEVLATALDEWGESVLPELNGMFAFAWTEDGSTVKLTRDRFGEVPLHCSRRSEGFFAVPFSFASETKAFVEPANAIDVPPGCLVTATKTDVRTRRWHRQKCEPVDLDRTNAATALRIALERAADERIMSDVPVCTLLSGGLDSAVVATLLKNRVPKLVAYTARFEETADLKHARKTAAFLGLELREVEVPLPTKDDLMEVIRTIEMPHKAQVEIGWACLKLAKVMKKDGFKVTFSGEGSDELWASYGFAYHGLKKKGWHEYRRDLFLDQSRKNFPRCNKAFMSAGVECRLPFLHPPVVDLALSLKKDVVGDRRRPKAVLEEAFRDELPPFLMTRPKVAFQDGMGLKKAIAEITFNGSDPKAFYARVFDDLRRRKR